MSEVMFKQVDLERTNKDGSLNRDTIWIDERYCIANTYVKRKIDGSWSNGWKVVSVYPQAKGQQEVLANRDHYKTHRKGTDI